MVFTKCSSARIIPFIERWTSPHPLFEHFKDAPFIPNHGIITWLPVEGPKQVFWGGFAQLSQSSVVPVSAWSKHQWRWRDETLSVSSLCGFSLKYMQERRGSHPVLFVFHTASQRFWNQGRVSRHYCTLKLGCNGSNCWTIYCTTVGLLNHWCIYQCRT